MNTKNNRRAQDSVERIVRTVYGIMWEQKKPVSKITVREVCEKAQINRSTFYAHFQDVYDVAERAEKQMAKMAGDAFMAHLPEEDWMRAGYTKLFEFIREYKEFYLLYLEDSRRMRVIEMMIEPHKDKLKAIKPQQFGYNSQEEIAYAQDFFAAGIVAMLHRWLKNGCKETPEALYSILQRHYPNGTF